MAILVNAHQLKKSFTSRPLFDRITFSIESGDRIGLIGPNGAGKSTLLKILAGQASVDEGTLSLQRGLRVAFLEQVPKFSEGSTILDSILEGSPNPTDWEEISQAHAIMSKLSLNENHNLTSETPVTSLSGGWKKRVALARELLRKPDLFLLDEPTNHLDIESILWLEELLSHSPFATLTITHDRLFLQRTSSRILELDRRLPDGLLSIKGDYATFLETRENLLAAQEMRETKLKNTLRRETEWLRRGAKARQTKQQARIQNAESLKGEVEELTSKNRTTAVRLDFQSLEKNPKKLIEAKLISKSYGNNMVVPPLSLVIGPKSRIGLVGPNGCGKSTFIKLLTGKETPDSGTVVHAEKLQVSYFEQNRESLDPRISLVDTVCLGGQYVDYGGTKIHVKSYLSRFLFSHEQMALPVGKLSGGEQSRLLLARLMLKEANLLVLDEPTNDLDIETLDVLEEVLKEFNGAVILVTHDRYFLDQIATQILGFGNDERGNKTVVSVAGLQQWESWHDQQILNRQNQEMKKVSPSVGPGATTKRKKLSYKEQREFDGMEANIKRAEESLAKLVTESTKAENLSDAVFLTELHTKIAATQAEIDRLYARWAELEK